MLQDGLLRYQFDTWKESLEMQGRIDCFQFYLNVTKYSQLV